MPDKSEDMPYSLNPKSEVLRILSNRGEILDTKEKLPRKVKKISLKYKRSLEKEFRKKKYNLWWFKANNINPAKVGRYSGFILSPLTKDWILSVNAR